MPKSKEHRVAILIDGMTETPVLHGMLKQAFVIRREPHQTILLVNPTSAEAVIKWLYAVATALEQHISKK